VSHGIEQRCAVAEARRALGLVELFRVVVECRQRIGDRLKGREYRLPVLCDGGLIIFLILALPRPQRTSMEQRLRQRPAASR